MKKTIAAILVAVIKNGVRKKGGEINEAKNNSRNSNLPKLGFFLAGTSPTIKLPCLMRAKTWGVS
jgi:hypothetical protein